MNCDFMTLKPFHTVCNSTSSGNICDAQYFILQSSRTNQQVILVCLSAQGSIDNHLYIATMNHFDNVWMSCTYFVYKIDMNAFYMQSAKSTESSVNFKSEQT